MWFRYWQIWVSVPVSDLYQNSGFGRTLERTIKICIINVRNFSFSLQYFRALMIVRHQANPIKHGKLIDSGEENRSIRSNLVQSVKNCLKPFYTHTGFRSVKVCTTLSNSFQNLVNHVSESSNIVRRPQNLITILALTNKNY